jgi:hypothetical protein
MYKIVNASGLTGDAWNAEYPHFKAAWEALRDAMGWRTIYTSHWFNAWSQPGDPSEECCAYETEEQCDADAEGAHAPRVQHYTRES